MVIKMLSDKSLIISNNTKIYQGENLVDDFKILVDPHYGEYDLRGFDAYIIYEDETNLVHKEALNMEHDLYKDTFVIYKLPITTSITNLAGNIELGLVFELKDNNSDRILTSGTLKVKINKVSYAFRNA